MGYNTTVVVLNDALHEIAADPKFGEKLASAIRSMMLPEEHRKKGVCSGGYGYAATVIETHHADRYVYVKVGGNCGEVVG